MPPLKKSSLLWQSHYSQYREVHSKHPLADQIKVFDLRVQYENARQRDTSYALPMKTNVSPATTLILTVFAFQHIAVDSARGAGIWTFDDIVDIYETLVRDLSVDELELVDCGIH